MVIFLLKFARAAGLTETKLFALNLKVLIIRVFPKHIDKPGMTLLVLSGITAAVLHLNHIAFSVLI